MHKRGDVRADGKVFLGYARGRSKTYERWVEPHKLVELKQKQKAYRQSRYEAYKRSVEGRGRPAVGQLDPVTGLYFLTVSSTGKEMWGDKEALEEMRRRMSLRCRRHAKRKYEAAPLPTVCVGDRHPSRDGLYVIKVSKVQIKYGTAEELRLSREATREKSRRYRAKNRQRFLDKYRERKDFLDRNPHLKRSRGDIDPITGKLFWGYSSTCIERWVTREQFEELRTRTRERYRSERRGPIKHAP